MIKKKTLILRGVFLTEDDEIFEKEGFFFPKHPLYIRYVLIG